jgi:hypothetical protein
MSVPNGKAVRKHKRRTDDGKGVRRLIAGKRFRTPAGVSTREADQRFSRIEDLWRDNEEFCQRIGRHQEWTEIALWAADKLRKGELRIPLPPIDDILWSFGDRKWPATIQLVIDRYTDDDAACHYPTTVDGLTWDEAKKFFDIVVEQFPSVNWLLPETHAGEIVNSHESAARWSLGQLAVAKDQSPPDPATPLISGTFHEALDAYKEKRRKDFTQPDGTFDGSGHHMLGIIRALRDRHDDFLLAELDFERCQGLVDFWRERPESERKKKPMGKKTCQNHIGELFRFLRWLHRTKEFQWKKSFDFSDVDRGVTKLDSDRKSIRKMEIDTFSVDELALLYKHAIRSERLLLVWCLNCAHGAAEFGRVEWEDLFLHQEHPWIKEGLKIDSGDDDCWCGLLRPKTDVLGWWLLWPETVQLIEWWQTELRQTLKHQPDNTDRVLLTDAGVPLYRDESRNAQTGFANAWNRLLDRVEKSEGEGKVRRLPFGTLRDQLPNWLGGDENNAIVASVALCHGLPHKGDKLLFGQYSNRPWAALFRSQQEYRQHLSPMFNAILDPLAEFDVTAEKVEALWNTGERNARKIANFLDVSEMTVRRRIKSLGLKPPKETD